MDIILAVLAGILVMLSMSINSGLSRHIGVFPGAAVNYCAGLLGVSILVLCTGSWRSLGQGAPIPWYALGGGALGVVVVSASNVVIPRIPVMYTTVLLFFGQLLAGMVIDACRSLVPSPWQLLGAGLILSGLLLNLHLDRRAATAVRPADESPAA
jgi:transporter family-2 protein